MVYGLTLLLQLLNYCVVVFLRLPSRLDSCERHRRNKSKGLSPETINTDAQKVQRPPGMSVSQLRTQSDIIIMIDEVYELY